MKRHPKFFHNLINLFARTISRVIRLKCYPVKKVRTYLISLEITLEQLKGDLGGGSNHTILVSFGWGEVAKCYCFFHSLEGGRPSGDKSVVFLELGNINVSM